MGTCFGCCMPPLKRYIKHWTYDIPILDYVVMGIVFYYSFFRKIKINLNSHFKPFNHIDAHMVLLKNYAKDKKAQKKMNKVVFP